MALVKEDIEKTWYRTPLTQAICLLGPKPDIAHDVKRPTSSHEEEFTVADGHLIYSFSAVVKKLIEDLDMVETDESSEGE